MIPTRRETSEGSKRPSPTGDPTNVPARARTDGMASSTMACIPCRSQCRKAHVAAFWRHRTKRFSRLLLRDRSSAGIAPMARSGRYVLDRDLMRESCMCVCAAVRAAAETPATTPVRRMLDFNGVGSPMVQCQPRRLPGRAYGTRQPRLPFAIALRPSLSPSPKPTLSGSRSSADHNTERRG